MSKPGKAITVGSAQLGAALVDALNQYLHEYGTETWTYEELERHAPSLGDRMLTYLRRVADDK